MLSPLHRRRLHCLHVAMLLVTLGMLTLAGWGARRFSALPPPVYPHFASLTAPARVEYPETERERIASAFYEATLANWRLSLRLNPTTQFIHEATSRLPYLICVGLPLFFVICLCWRRTVRQRKSVMQVVVVIALHLLICLLGWNIMMSMLQALKPVSLLRPTSVNVAPLPDAWSNPETTQEIEASLFFRERLDEASAYCQAKNEYLLVLDKGRSRFCLSIGIAALMLLACACRSLVELYLAMNEHSYT